VVTTPVVCGLVNRSTLRSQVSRAVVPMLEPDEKIIQWGPAWIAEPRPRIPTFVLKRTLLGVAITDRRFFVVDQPRRRRAVTRDVVLATHHDACRLVAYRTWRPMLHVRLRRADGRPLVAEFRPRDRPIGRALAASLRQWPRPTVHDLREAGVPEADIPTEEVPVVSLAQEAPPSPS